MSRDIPTPPQIGTPRTTLDRARAYERLQTIHSEQHALQDATGLEGDQLEAALKLLSLPAAVRYGITVRRVTEYQARALLQLEDEAWIVTGYEALCKETHTEEQLAELIDRMQSLKNHAVTYRQGMEKIEEYANEMARFGKRLSAASPEKQRAYLAEGLTTSDLHFCIKLSQTSDSKTRRELLLDRIYEQIKTALRGRTGLANDELSEV